MYTVYEGLPASYPVKYSKKSSQLNFYNFFLILALIFSFLALVMNFLLIYDIFVYIVV